MVDMREGGVRYSSVVKSSGNVSISRRSTKGGNRDISIPFEFLKRVMNEDRYGSTIYKVDTLLELVKEFQDRGRNEAHMLDSGKCIAFLGKLWSLAVQIESDIDRIPDTGPNSTREIRQQCKAGMSSFYKEMARCSAIMSHQGNSKFPEIGSLELGQQFDMKLLHNGDKAHESE